MDLHYDAVLRRHQLSYVACLYICKLRRFHNTLNGKILILLGSFHGVGGVYDLVNYIARCLYKET